MYALQCGQMLELDELLTVWTAAQSKQVMSRVFWREKISPSLARKEGSSLLKIGLDFPGS
jgi:hypothetical protein